MSDTDAETSEWDDVGEVVSSKYRRRTLEVLREGPATPTQIDKDNMSKVSHALSALRDRGMAELMVSEDRKKGRIYRITEYGHKILGKIEDNGLE